MHREYRTILYYHKDANKITIANAAAHTSTLALFYEHIS